MINVQVIGGAGYTAGELIRLLINHPEVSLKHVVSASQAGKKVGDVHRDLDGETNLQFVSPDADTYDNADVIFLCLGHGKSMDFLQKHQMDDVPCIDLSQDFRHNHSAILGNRKFVYGLTELNKSSIAGAKNIANPGCFATAIQLAVLPLAKAQQLNALHIHAITGSTGAGQSLSSTTHFSWRQNNISVYKPFSHQHEIEILQTIEKLDPTFNGNMNFIPVRGNFTRGIFCTVYLQSSLDIDQAKKLYTDVYESSPFVHLTELPVDLKQVVNTNKCLVHLEKHGEKLLITTVIDNLLKGASGQAVQNMNLMFGLEETSGLKLKSTYF